MLLFQRVSVSRRVCRVIVLCDWMALAVVRHGKECRVVICHVLSLPFEETEPRDRTVFAQQLLMILTCKSAVG